MSIVNALSTLAELLILLYEIQYLLSVASLLRISQAFFEKCLAGPPGSRRGQRPPGCDTQLMHGLLGQ